MNIADSILRSLVGVLLSSVLFVAPAVEAQQQSSRWTAAEIASLPQYCQDRLSGDRGRMERWNRAFTRSNVNHLHHYCYGLMQMTRATSEFDRSLQRRYARRAIGEFNYVLTRWPHTFPLYREAQMYKLQMEALAQ